MLAELTLLFFLILFTFAASDPQWIGWVRGRRSARFREGCCLSSCCALASLRLRALSQRAGIRVSCVFCVARGSVTSVYLATFAQHPLSTPPALAVDDDNFARRADHD